MLVQLTIAAKVARIVYTLCSSLLGLFALFTGRRRHVTRYKFG